MKSSVSSVLSVLKRAIRLLLSTLVFFMAYISAASACVDGEPDRSLVPKIIEQAYFIGKVRVIDIILPAGQQESRSTLTLEILESYKGAINEDVITAYQPGGCSKGFPKEGGIYEEMIFINDSEYLATDIKSPVSKDAKVLSRRTQYPFEEDWEKLRTQSDISSSLRDEIKACKEQGGIWDSEVMGSYRFRVFDCHFEASDSGKECTDSSECEGLCIAGLQQKDSGKVDRYYSAKAKLLKLDEDDSLYEFHRNIYESDIKNAHDLIKKMTGHCSQWLKPNGCYHVLNQGIPEDTRCFAMFG